MNLLETSFPEQTDFINDPSKLKAALCSRRSGKSYGLGIYLFQEALTTAKCKVLYVGLTRDSAKANMWDDVLKRINTDHNIGARFNEVALTVKLPNGSMIYLMGANSSQDLREKLRGNKYKLACVDECQSYTQNLKEIVSRVIEPATIDHDGTICLTGTPGNLIRMARRRIGLFGNVEREEEDPDQYHFWYAVSNGLEAGWSVHKWLADKNPHTAVNFAKKIASITAATPTIVDTPRFKQEYLGEWFVDLEKLVYKFDELKNLCTDEDIIRSFQDPQQRAQYGYALAIDFGYTDSMAFCLCAYRPFDSKLYVVETYKKSKMLIHHMNSKILDFKTRYPISKIIADTGGAGKQSTEELIRRYGHSIQAADKRDKNDFIAMMNSDLIMEKIKLLPGNDALISEWQSLIWDERSDRQQENAACENHLSDSCLYAWRYCYNYLAQSQPKIIQPGSPEALDAYWKKKGDKIEKRKTGNEEFWESDWDLFSKI